MLLQKWLEVHSTHLRVELVFLEQPYHGNDKETAERKETLRVHFNRYLCWSSYVYNYNIITQGWFFPHYARNHQ